MTPLSESSDYFDTANLSADMDIKEMERMILSLKSRKEKSLQSSKPVVISKPRISSSKSLPAFSQRLKFGRLKRRRRNSLLTSFNNVPMIGNTPSTPETKREFNRVLLLGALGMNVDVKNIEKINNNVPKTKNTKRNGSKIVYL